METVTISAIEHFLYCPRQCALIHVEQVFDENVFTLKGREIHDRAHTVGVETREGVRSHYAVPLWSERLGLSGKADVVETHANGDIIPVEYKHGSQGRRMHDMCQLCAQALCLEEMVGQAVPEGRLYYHGSRRMVDVEFGPDLRSRTHEAIEAVRDMLAAHHTPAPLADARCRRCSLHEACQPELIATATRMDSGVGAFESSTGTDSCSDEWSVE